MHLSTAFSLIKMSYLHLNNFSIFSGPPPPPKKKSHLNDYSLKKKEPYNHLSMKFYFKKDTLTMTILNISRRSIPPYYQIYVFSDHWLCSGSAVWTDKCMAT